MEKTDTVGQPQLVSRACPKSPTVACILMFDETLELIPMLLQNFTVVLTRPLVQVILGQSDTALTFLLQL